MAAEAIAAGDADTACAALAISARASFSEGQPADPERVELLRAALAMDGHAPQQRATLLGELAVELIFERDIPGGGPRSRSTTGSSTRCHRPSAGGS